MFLYRRYDNPPYGLCSRNGKKRSEGRLPFSDFSVFHTFRTDFVLSVQQARFSCVTNYQRKEIYGPSSIGVETASGRISTSSSKLKRDCTKSYTIGKKKSYPRDNVEYTVRACPRPFILIGVTDCSNPRWRDAKIARFLTFDDHIF